MKRKRARVDAPKQPLHTSKPSAIFRPSGGRAYTLSVALPGSVISKASSALAPELKTILSGQIARALAVFCVDEVVVFDDGQAKRHKSKEDPNEDAFNGFTGYSNPDYFLMHILSYLETPPFLRRHLFPMHPDLRFAGSLPSLDMPHHPRSEEWCRYREGVIVHESGMDDGSRKKRGIGDSQVEGRSIVDVGLQRKVSIPAVIPVKTRVTVKLPEESGRSVDQKSQMAASAVEPSEPREVAGYYWGYNVRAAASLSAVFTECTYPEGYDLTFGTSERGIPISSLANPVAMGGNPTVPEFSHMMIAFGGIAGLEVAVEADEELLKMGVSEPKDIFDYWVNLCPGQGSRTIRTEEAVWLGLMGLREIVLSKGKK
ncbi:MAG: hypothetical protein Q9174_001885 [Haloplaca sp. 1 TL-2023]